ncbi:MAG: hypothetical protein ACOC7J_06475 [Armatimonadota bacterium]
MTGGNKKQHMDAEVNVWVTLRENGSNAEVRFYYYYRNEGVMQQEEKVRQALEEAFPQATVSGTIEDPQCFRMFRVTGLDAMKYRMKTYQQHKEGK